MYRREFLGVALGTGAVSLSGCSSLLEEEVKSGEISCEGTRELKIGYEDFEVYEENEWVQNISGGVESAEIGVNYNGEDVLVDYGRVGLIDEEVQSGKVKVGTYEGDDVFRYFKLKSMSEDRAVLETGLDTDGWGDADFGEYEKVCRT